MYRSGHRITLAGFIIIYIFISSLLKTYSQLLMARKILIPVLLFIFHVMCNGQDTEVELWLDAQIRKDFNKKFRAYYEQGYRRDEFLTNSKALYFETGGYYKPAKFLWLGPNYRFATNLRDYRRNRLAGEVIFRGDIRRFNLKLRNKYMAEFGGGEETDHYFRERISADYNIRHLKIDPFIASELIFHLQPDRTEYEQFRFDIGADWKLAKHHCLEFYYRYRIKRNVKNPLNSHIFGIEYVFEF
jgi:hypothetical protein